MGGAGLDSAVDEPGALPNGVGSALLNFLALQADDRPLTTLKYRGPYPTLALFESLGASFMPPTPVEEALRRFTEGVEEAALAARVVEPSVAFRPSPFELQWLDERICFQQRYGVERVFFDGQSYERRETVCRVVRDDDDLELQVWFANKLWWRVARLGVEGTLKEEFQRPTLEQDWFDKPLPQGLREALARSWCRLHRQCSNKLINLFGRTSQSFLVMLDLRPLSSTVLRLSYTLR